MITALTLAPVVAAVLILALPERRARAVALAGALVSLSLAVWMLVQFNEQPGDLKFEEKVEWIPTLGIDYFVGLDGTNALVLLLSALLAPLVVLASWQHTDRPRTYFVLLSLLFTGLFGTFTALNFFHWFIYWELALVPPFFIIKLFGKGEERHSAALNFFLFTVLGSVAMLLGFLFLYQQTDTFDFIELAEKGVSPLIFCAVLAGLWVKVPLAPLHIWQAPAYAAAPTPVAMLLTGVMSKMGVYGFLRIIVPIFPEQLKQHAGTLMAFALVTILWGAFLALRQTDLKRLLAFSSLNHVAYCVLGVGALGIAADGLKVDAHALATQGVILQMFAHGLAAAGLFYLVGLLEERTGLRGRNDFGGLSAVTPRFAAVFFILTFCSLGLPFMAGFAAEFLIFSGTFAVAPGVTIAATLGLLATAVFLLTMLQRVFTGPINEQYKSMPDLTRNEILILTPIIILIFWAGIYPTTWLEFSQKLTHMIP
ncbi:MAG: NADH-quinone oxidoreductase subunit M [Limisphaerales bacterium]|jgi:NADH-quinone oxidoreductase subunit M